MVAQVLTIPSQSTTCQFILLPEQSYLLQNAATSPASPCSLFDTFQRSEWGVGGKLFGTWIFTSRAGWHLGKLRGALVEDPWPLEGQFSQACPGSFLEAAVAEGTAHHQMVVFSIICISELSLYARMDTHKTPINIPPVFQTRYKIQLKGNAVCRQTHKTGKGKY